MNFLVDTCLLLWGANNPEKISEAARGLIDAPDSHSWFSAVSIWEVAIKRNRGRADFTTDPRRLRRGLLDHGWRELPVTSAHALAVMDLPPIHKDPFDRMLLAQAIAEGFTLLTSDKQLALYPGDVRRV